MVDRSGDDERPVDQRPAAWETAARTGVRDGVPVDAAPGAVRRAPRNLRHPSM